MPPMVYRHTQTGWYLIIGPAIFLTAAVAAVRWVPAIVVAMLAIDVLVVLAFGWLTIAVDNEAVEARFGFGILRRRVPLATIAACSTVRNPWYYGWGIHLIPGGTVYNIAGRTAVEMRLVNGRLFRFGTDEPTRLAGIINSQLGDEARQLSAILQPSN